MKIITYQVLIIEDSSEWFDDMIYSLELFSRQINTKLNIKLAKDCHTARLLMRGELFHSITIDLRLPEKTGGPLTSEPMGVELANIQMQIKPLVWGHLFSGFAKEYALDCYRKINDKDSPTTPPIWEKASSDNEGPDAYTQRQWR